MFRYSIMILGLAVLGGCQSAPATRPAPFQAGAAPLSDAGMQQALGVADRAGAMAPAVGAAGLVGGLDPTGLLQTATNAEAERRMRELQRFMPGMMARNNQDTARLCASRPTEPELAEACGELAALQAEAAAQGARR